MGIPAPIGVSASGKPGAGDQANAVLSGVFGAIGPGAPFAFRGPMNLSIYASYNSALTTAAGSLAATVAVAGAIAVGNAINSVNVPPGTTVGAIVGAAITLKIPPISLTGKVSTAAAAITDLARTDGLVGATVSGPGIPSGTTVLAIAVTAIPATADNPQGVLGTVQLSALPTASTVDPNKPDAFSFARTANAITTTGADASAIFTGAEIVYSGTIQLERSFDGGSTFLPANIGGAGALAQWNAGTPVSLVFGEPEKQVLYRLNCIAYASGVINYRFSETGGAAESLAIGPLI
jgi:hypothetical protein